MSKESLRRLFLKDLKNYELKKNDIKNLNQRLIDLLKLLKCQNIGAFYPKDFETDIMISLNTILKEKSLCLPKIEHNDISFYKISSLEKDLKIGKFKINEPVCNLEKVTKNNLEAIIVPGLIFDENGNRIGFGKGFYDKFLNGFKGIKIGVCYEKFLIDKIETEKHDIPVDYLITN